MPEGSKGRQRIHSWDWDASGAEENHMNDAGNRNNRVDAMEVSARENDT